MATRMDKRGSRSRASPSSVHFSLSGIRVANGVAEISLLDSLALVSSAHRVTSLVRSLFSFFFFSFFSLFNILTGRVDFCVDCAKGDVWITKDTVNYCQRNVKTKKRDT